MAGIKCGNYSSSGVFIKGPTVCFCSCTWYLALVYSPSIHHLLNSKPSGRATEYQIRKTIAQSVHKKISPFLADTQIRCHQLLSSFSSLQSPSLGLFHFHTWEGSAGMELHPSLSLWAWQSSAHTGSAAPGHLLQLHPSVASLENLYSPWPGLAEIFPPSRFLSASC